MLPFPSTSPGGAHKVPLHSTSNVIGNRTASCHRQLCPQLHGHPPKIHSYGAWLVCLVAVEWMSICLSTLQQKQSRGQTNKVRDPSKYWGDRGRTIGLTHWHFWFGFMLVLDSWWFDWWFCFLTNGLECAVYYAILYYKVCCLLWKSRITFSRVNKQISSPISKI